MRSRRFGIVFGVLLFLGGTSILGHDLYLGAKAALARVRIRQAFGLHLADGRSHPPWPWADMAPVARLDFPGRGIRRYVLTGGTGESLAFDVGHIHGTSFPNRPGNCVVTGHRDGRFAFLERLTPGDLVVVRTFGSTREYRVDSGTVVSAGDTTVLANDGDRLTLVTCWPFDGLTRSTLRYVVSCRPTDGVRYAREKDRRSTAGLLPGAAGYGG
ncbi:MAG: class GN sortase [Acidobacteria bacterium]|uniref:Class GN sortase n=1 Tax=Candidatus Polarisedimenticola svalbardensis TaxID=2886004 RepID=A0A8J7C373_9BACT|nr:class GN sortase [Candidatus Polarisedimenticola svalbardensis]